ncbi:LuxR C-terminal-related transcriptional regulator [Variovorax sp. J22R24]|uniref:LuxR C-terminal-related transcriptional regulator n=1 Tax=Variovorax gracilis TaxID=3053502 RepID=UPI002575B055|nr:LuxR C-terminal-related transcriptional regulator [Variovorax sp. J22R24]MDM0110243.1 LuxR C-terminal-related transcriptional regulator [Variovorax sp. J22R24]
MLIAEQTVKQHRGRVMEKMGVRSVAELVQACEAAGLLTNQPASAGSLHANIVNPQSKGPAKP